MNGAAWSHWSDIVGRQEASLAGSLVVAEHPASVDLLGVTDHVSLQQGELISRRRHVAEHSLVVPLEQRTHTHTNTLS